MVWTALPDGNIDFVNHRWREFTNLGASESSCMSYGRYTCCTTLIVADLSVLPQ
jgi:hypothetical protein